VKKHKNFLYLLGLALLLPNLAFNKKAQKVNKAGNKNRCFSLGESLHYRVHYGIINAAKITLRVHDEMVKVGGTETYKITADGKTIGGFYYLYKVKDHFESYLNPSNLLPMKYYKKVRENKYRSEDLVRYDHQKKMAYGKKENTPISAAVQDVVSALYYARNIDFSEAKIGQSYPVDIYLDQQLYQLGFTYLGKEILDSDMGKIACLKMRPQVVKDEIFESEDALTFWLSDDQNKVPIRVRAKIWVGSFKIDLSKAEKLRYPLARL
tara:strand:+ start:2070 stop:2867 length:798 start_codon:yes stop_codon:yes gene_type:complete